MTRMHRDLRGVISQYWLHRQTLSPPRVRPGFHGKNGSLDSGQQNLASHFLLTSL